MTAVERDLPQERRERIQAHETVAWTQTLGREIQVPPMPAALTEVALSGLETMKFQPVYVPSITLPSREELLEAHDIHAAVHRISGDNPNLLQTPRERRYMASVLACYAKSIIPSQIPTAAKWAAIEAWDGLTSNQVDMLTELTREQEQLLDARFGLPLTRFLAPLHDEHRIEEKGEESAQTMLDIQSRLAKIGLSDGTISVPTVLDAFLLSRRSDREWKFSEEGEWTKTMYFDPNPTVEVKSHCYLVAKNMGTGNPELAAHEGAKHASQIGLRPMITF